MAISALTPIDFPNNQILESPWTDPNGQIWIWNDFGWVRDKSFTDTITDISKDLEGQYLRKNGYWSSVETSQRYYGARTNQPITRNDGTVPIAGDGYFDTIQGVQKLFDSTQWRKYGKTDAINNVDIYVWEGLTLTNGDVLSKTDSNGKSLPTFFRQESMEVMLYSDGLLLSESIPERAGDYSIDYTAATIIIDDATKFPASTIIELKVLITKHQNKFVYPHTSYLEYPATGLDIFTIIGGNFDQDSRVIGEENKNNIVTTSVISDFQILFKVTNTNILKEYLRVINGYNRQSFGNPILLSDISGGVIVP